MNYVACSIRSPTGGVSPDIAKGDTITELCDRLSANLSYDQQREIAESAGDVTIVIWYLPPEKEHS